MFSPIGSYDIYSKYVLKQNQFLLYSTHGIDNCNETHENRCRFEACVRHYWQAQSKALAGGGEGPDSNS